VFLINQFGLGGSERQLYLFLKHADRQVFECHVLVFNPSPNLVYDDLAQKLGAQVWHVPDSCQRVERRPGYLLRFFRELDPDVVHSWSFHDNAYAGLVGWLTRVPVRIGSLRDSFYSAEVQGLPAIYRSLALYSVSRLVVNSNDIRDELVAAHYPAARILVVANGVEAELRDESCPVAAADLSALGVQPGQRVVGSVGNLRSKKNHLMFVRGMAQVLQHIPEAFGLVVGQPMASEPDLPAQLRAEIRRLGVEGRVILAGFRSDVPALMRRMEVFCLTSRHEGMPNVVLEAMAAARPVVATRVAGVRGLVHDGVNGLLVDADDVEGFAAAVEHLLNNPALARKMGEAGREMVERQYSCEQAARSLSSLYCDGLAAKGWRAPLAPIRPCADR